jgi:hypothetical protein
MSMAIMPETILAARGSGSAARTHAGASAKPPAPARPDNTLRREAPDRSFRMGRVEPNSGGRATAALAPR